VGPDTLQELELLAEPLQGMTVLNVNSTAVGGGVAEILDRLLPLLRELGVSATWEVIKGGEDFYVVTKKFHNALHGDPVTISSRDFQVYEDTQEKYFSSMDLGADFVYIHDPQPVALVKKRREFQNHWIWRCHVDLTRRNQEVWEFLRPYVEAYDASVFSAPSFAQDLPIPQVLIPPSIDPLSEKNRDLSQEEVDGVLCQLGIPRDKPLVAQVSRFDRLKDPVGVIDAFKQARQRVPCRLLLAGGSADDDPEGARVLAEVREKAGKDPDIMILCLPPTSHKEINAIQRASSVIIQKSIREGFGLTVTEALWKGKPVIASAVGGIPLQIIHNQTGILVHSLDGAAYWIRRLLQQPSHALRLGENGRRHVHQNFLITRHLRDYLLLFLSVLNPGEQIIRLNRS
jgi:trehalose synthase